MTLEPFRNNAGGGELTATIYMIGKEMPDDRKELVARAMLHCQNVVNAILAGNDYDLEMVHSHLVLSQGALSLPVIAHHEQSTSYIPPDQVSRARGIVRLQ